MRGILSGVWLRNRWRFSFLKPLWRLWRVACRRWAPFRSRLAGVVGVDAYLRESADQDPPVRLFEATVIRRRSPLGLVGAIPRPMMEGLDVDVGEDRVVRIRGCRFLGGLYPALITGDDRLLSDLSPDVWGSENHWAFGRPLPGCWEELGGVTAVVTTPSAENNYGHWMMDCLPRLLLLEMAGYGPGKIDRYLMHMGDAPFYAETLSALGIPAERVVRVEGRRALMLRDAVIPTWRDWRFGFQPWILDVLPGRLSGGTTAVAGRGGRRLYLSREGVACRRLLNEGQCLGILEEAGFELFRPARWTVREQAAAFAGAEAVVSVHGSGLANLMFCRPGTKVLEIFPSNYIDLAMWTLACVRGLDYRVMVGESAGGPREERSGALQNRSDLRVAPEELKRALSWGVAS